MYYCYLIHQELEEFQENDVKFLLGVRFLEHNMREADGSLNDLGVQIESLAERLLMEAANAGHRESADTLKQLGIR